MLTMVEILIKYRFTSLKFGMYVRDNYNVVVTGVSRCYVYVTTYNDKMKREVNHFEVTDSIELEKILKDKFGSSKK